MRADTDATGLDSGTAEAELFAALANNDRLLILSVMLAAEAEGRHFSITRLAAATEISRFAASRHLAILRRVGLIQVQFEGRRAIHQLSASRFEALEDWLYPFVLRSQAIHKW